MAPLRQGYGGQAVTDRRGSIAAAAAIALVGAFLLQCLAFVEANGQTYDEGVTLAAGLRLLDTGRDDVNLEHPPLAKLIVAWPVRTFAAPRLDVDAWRARRESAFGLGRDLFYSSGVPHERLLRLGRAPVVSLSLALVALIGLFAWRLWGPRAAVGSAGGAARACPRRVRSHAGRPRLADRPGHAAHPLGRRRLLLRERVPQACPP